MTYYMTPVVAEQDENVYYTYVPVWEGSQTADDNLDEVLPDIWEAVARYLETITEEKIATSV